MIGTLPALAPDSQRSEQTIARCHELLARQRARHEATRRSSNTRYRFIERALIGALCVVYLSGVAVVAIQVLMGG
jgi:hypothetical protein